MSKSQEKCGSQAIEAHNDALVAKQKALSSMKQCLRNLNSINIDVALAAVLLFVDFELIDSGRDTWTFHINGARTIIETLCGSNKLTAATMSPLQKCLISNFMVYVRPSNPHSCRSDFIV